MFQPAFCLLFFLGGVCGFDFGDVPVMRDLADFVLLVVAVFVNFLGGLLLDDALLDACEPALA